MQAHRFRHWRPCWLQPAEAVVVAVAAAVAREVVAVVALALKSKNYKVLSCFRVKKQQEGGNAKGKTGRFRLCARKQLHSMATG